ncbi:unnamed protein product [Ectocarpus fasciculatus]
MAGSSSGCPVQHAPKESQSMPAAAAAAAAAGNESTGSSTEQEQGGRGRWAARVAAWLPFRQGGGGGGGSAAKSSGGSVGAAAPAAAIQGSTARQETKEEHGGGGGCPVNSSDEDGGDAAIPPSSSSSGCPVQHDSATSTAAPAAEGLGRVWGYLTGSIGGAGGGGDASSPTVPAAESPELYNARNNEYVYGQEVAAGQEVPLSTSRQRSSIPKAEFNPDHQPQKEAEKWVYPSEQQYYNAIKRKGYKASAADMPSTLAIHNAVNEKGWQMVQEWERAHAEAAATATPAAGGGEGGAGVPAPKLLRFTGRPQDTSPKAWVKSTLLGYRPPFDRHDWVVKRADGTEARYVIDFYAGKAPPGSSMPVAMHLDVRPALDSCDAVVDRTRMFYSREVRPYLSGVLDAFKNDPGPPPSDQDAPPPPSVAR